MRSYMTSVANKNFAKPRRKYLSNRGARSKPIEIRVADLSPNRGAPVFRGSKVAQLHNLAAVLATLAMSCIVIKT